MTFIKMGFRSLFRQKRRTIIALVVITIGIGFLLLTIGHARYIDWGLRESTIHSETGHLQVFQSAYFDRAEKAVLEHGLENYEQLRNDLDRMADVSLVLARIDLMGLLSNGEKSVACLGQGVEPAKEKRLRGLFRMSSSSFDAFIVHEGEAEIIVLGKKLAESLNAKEGDYLTLMTTTASGALNALDLKMVGTFRASSPDYEERAVILPLRTAQALLDTKKVKNLIVTLTDTGKTDLAYEKISELSRQKGYPIVLKKWHERAVYYKQVKQFYNQITGFLSMVLFIIVFFSTSNTIVMSVIERTREVGTMLSLGASRRQTLIMFFFEGTFIGFIGGILSAVFAYAASLLINSFQISLPAPPGLSDAYPLMIRNDGRFYALIFLATIGIASISALMPAWRATRLKIVDALGHI
jgi:putative ABC transport system permease protein